MPFVALLILAVLATLVIAEFAPSAVNMFLLLLLIGLLLGQSQKAAELITSISSVARRR